MPYPLTSGFGLGGQRSRSGGRAVPLWGGHLNFANAIQTYRSAYFPGPHALAYCSGQQTVSAMFNNGGSTFSAVSLMAWWAVPPNYNPANLNGIIGASTNTTSNGLGLMFASANTVKIWVNAQATAANNAVSATISNLSSWHFTCGTWDAGAASPTMRLFQDGGVSAADTGTLATAANFPVSPLFLGNSLSGAVVGGANIPKLYIAQAAIWNRALTSGEVTTLYNSGSPFDINSDAGLLSGLLGWWSPGNAPGEYQDSPNFLDLSSGGFDMVRSAIGPVDVYGPRAVTYAP